MHGFIVDLRQSLRAFAREPCVKPIAGRTALFPFAPASYIVGRFDLGIDQGEAP